MSHPEPAVPMVTRIHLDHPSAAPRTAPGEPSRPRFTRDGSDDLEMHLATVCDQVGAAVRALVAPARLEAILLGGGYGRGEGGVLRTAAGDFPYNDLEFYVGIRGNRFVNRWRYASALHQRTQALRPAGVELELKIISLDYLRRSPPTMFHYDLVAGHRWLYGSESLLDGCEHHRDPDRIPLAEATRLLMNRLTGLLFARQRLERHPLTEENADFVGRNLAKAQLAFGDAILTAVGRYHWSCVERQARLQQLTRLDSLPWFDEIRHHHRAGVEFKLHPHRAPANAADLWARFETLRSLGLAVWLWIENRRLGTAHQSAGAYALGPIRPGEVSSRWRNLLLNLKVFGPAILTQPGVTHPPMERLFRSVALLVWESANGDPRLHRRLRRDLQVRPGSPQALIQAYESRWARLN